jgi:cathepsin X
MTYLSIFYFLFLSSCILILIVESFPQNATVAEYGMIEEGDVNAIMSEIYARGPVAATINAEPIVDYTGGVFTDTTKSTRTNHIVSIVGWGMDEESGRRHWIVRNSWGHYWGELGYMRVEMGSNILGLEGEVAWATPGSWTETNFPCAEDGANCNSGNGVAMKVQDGAMFYMDPSNDVQSVQRRLRADGDSTVDSKKNLRA